MLPWPVLQEDLGTVAEAMPITSRVVRSEFADMTIQVEGKVAYESN